MTIPDRALMLLRAYGASLDPPRAVDQLFLLGPGQQGFAARRARAGAWAALRGEQDAEGRPLWTYAEIADWFGVCRSGVHRAVSAIELRRSDASTRREARQVS